MPWRQWCFVVGTVGMVYALGRPDVTMAPHGLCLPWSLCKGSHGDNRLSDMPGTFLVLGLLGARVVVISQ